MKGISLGFFRGPWGRKAPQDHYFKIEVDFDPSLPDRNAGNYSVEAILETVRSNLLKKGIPAQSFRLGYSESIIALMVDENGAQTARDLLDYISQKANVRVHSSDKEETAEIFQAIHASEVPEDEDSGQELPETEAVQKVSSGSVGGQRKPALSPEEQVIKAEAMEVLSGQVADYAFWNSGDSKKKISLDGIKDWVERTIPEEIEPKSIKIVNNIVVLETLSKYEERLKPWLQYLFERHGISCVRNIV